MKANLITAVKAAVLGTALLLDSTAWAGFKYTPEVEVGVTSGGVRYARGSMVGARYSSDTIQRIGCTLNNSYAACSAQDKNNRSLSCSTTNTVVRAMVQGITDSSFIYFIPDNNGLCTLLQIDNRSEHLK